MSVVSLQGAGVRAAVYLGCAAALLVAVGLAAQADLGLGSPTFNPWGIAEAENYTRPYVGSPCEPSPASEHTRPWVDPSASNGYYAFTGHSPCGFIYDDMPFPTTGQFDRLFVRSGGSAATINVRVDVFVDGVLTAQTVTPMNCCIPFADIPLSPVGAGTVTAGLHDVDIRFTRLPSGDFHNYEFDCFKFEETDLGPCNPPLPSAGLSFGPANPCVGETVNFSDLSLAGHALVPLREGTWDFGDGSTTTFNPWTGSATSHAYAAAGTYTVSLQVKDVRDRVATATETVEVTNCPVADFTCRGIENPYLRVLFSDLTADADGDVVSHAWDFGDGSNGTGAPTSHDYAAEGFYDVTLTVTDALGHADSVTKRCYADLNLPPRIDPLPRPVVLEEDVVAFTVRASDPDGDPLTFTWNPGGLGAFGAFDPATQRFHWATRVGHAGTYEPVEFFVSDGRHTVMAATTIVVRPLPEEPAPENSDADHDGVPDMHDPCPADPAGCGEAPGATDGDGGDDHGAGTAPPGTGTDGGSVPCDAETRAVEARAAPTAAGDVRVAWRVEGCGPVARFLVWSSDGPDLDGPDAGAGAFLSRVPYVEGQRLYATVRGDPPDAAHRYYVRAIPLGAAEAQDTATAAVSNLIDPEGCRRNGARSDACLGATVQPTPEVQETQPDPDREPPRRLPAMVPVAVGTFSALAAIGILLLFARRRRPALAAGQRAPQKA